MAPVLDRPFLLEARERLPDGSGGVIETWVTLGTLWGELRPGPAREEIVDTRNQSRQGHRILVRASPQGAPSRPIPGQRFREGSRLFRIHAVSEADESARFLLCMVSEEVAP